ncbi:hypothetical protein NAEGRDRAFT_73058 [Naegleria gruberi]|uniref:protein-tyrosine-phosphatase n=1 Tax=Naegleria gruberi TaxID=5762 RepID=D2VVL2_NAEGR|nr:uncharacterized protein NAEGRDRAFT_73058 [Naegleria gruberi]EFC39056.1 hypothetical protein NAEGRDRAFT_73058 [Naegleria gruberi]|eukprot:XP_002671800.1 hypothetical protein NAEGRDRAFT_73058 [Naegleria gruberi strain NEG-M]
MGNKQTNRTSDSHPHQVDFIPKEYLPMNETCMLGMMMCPGRNKKIHRRNLQQDLERIRDKFDGQTIVTLVRNEELEEMNIVEYLPKIKQEFGMKSIHFPIRDKSLPNDKEEFCKLIDEIIQELINGRRVIVHCNGGKGRAATVCTAVLQVLKVRKVKCQEYISSSSNAMTIVRTTRGSGTLQNPIQIIWLKTKFLSYYENEHFKGS